MAVAVAALPCASKMSSVHAQSPQDALLDALLSSCEKPASLPLNSFGRDLKPYFPQSNDISSCVLPVCTITKKTRHKANVQPVASAAAAAAASTTMAAAISTKANYTKVTSPPKKGGASKGKAIHSRKHEARLGLATSPPAADTSLVPFNSGDMAAFLSWAGPGFYVAPSPDKLPLPTALLLD